MGTGGISGGVVGAARLGERDGVGAGGEAAAVVDRLARAVGRVVAAVAVGRAATERVAGVPLAGGRRAGTATDGVAAADGRRAGVGGAAPGAPSLARDARVADRAARCLVTGPLPRVIIIAGSGGVAAWPPGTTSAAAAAMGQACSITPCWNWPQNGASGGRLQGEGGGVVGLIARICGTGREDRSPAKFACNSSHCAFAISSVVGGASGVM